jgi:GT2 family glycosyltransferase
VSEAEAIDIGWCDPGLVAGDFAVSIGASIRDLEYFGAMGKLHRVSSSLLVAARNAVVTKFLDTSSSPWLWFVDSDMVFDKGHPQKLWETANENNVKMVSGLAFIFKDGRQPVPSIFYPGDPDPDEIRMALNKIPEQPCKVVATGFASTLIHRDVFEAMQPARHKQYRWFDLLDITSNEGIAGEDVQFFVRAAELGFDLWVNPQAETGHIKEITISRQDFNRYWELNAA